MPDPRDGLPAVGRSKDVVCPVCEAPVGVRCKDAPHLSLWKDSEGRLSPANHVERGRQARWMQMGFSTDQPYWQD